MILDFQGKRPKFDATVFIARNATVIGDVDLGSETNVWFYCLLRGDVNTIRVGAGCTIQDACILHVGRDLFPLDLEDEVVLGHRVTVHGCRIGRGAMIGIGATVLNGARIGEEAIIGAGAVVTPGSVIPPRMLALGIPAKPVRELAEKDFAMIRRTRESYRNLMTIYMKMQD
ncbi:MAG: gamma carbonic anhydrase family protein [Deltaproteobacteria bacterium]|nr:gamma carbonic anhydrase family protein [Deltaproteobacteria bacterium]